MLRQLVNFHNNCACVSKYVRQRFGTTLLQDPRLCRLQYSQWSTVLVCSATSTVQQLRLYATSRDSSKATGYQLKNNLKDCYFILGLTEVCTDDQLREAYLKKVKEYHPDSQSSTADSKKFSQVKEAYLAIQDHRKYKPVVEELLVDLEEEEDRPPSQLVHRQFLSYEGVGSGTLSQRQKQYEQYRVNKAVDRVYQYKVKKMESVEENALIVKDKRAARRAKMTNSVDRLVEDLILQAMQKGDFKNLSGSGKPLDLAKKDRHHYLDRTTQRFNQILIDDDMLPDWILMEKEIREEAQKARARLATERFRLGDPPFESVKMKHWRQQVETFQTLIADINSKINRYNLVVPILNKQKVHYSCDKEVDRIFNNCEKYLPTDCPQTLTSSETPRMSDYDIYTNIEWREIWRNIKEVFKYRG